MFKISPFKLTMYETCPQQYKFTYVDYLGDDYKTPKPYLTMGAHVHNSLKDLYEKYLPVERNYEVLEKLLRKRWKENRKGFTDLADEKKWGIKALQMLKLFSYKTDLTKTPVMLENYYDTDIAEDIKVLGRIDRVDEDPEGLHVIDYKTGQFKEDEVSDLQLAVYALIIQANQPKPVYKASYFYLASNQWYSIDISDDLFEPIKEELIEKVNQIRTDTQLLPRISSRCKHCDFIEICPKSAQAKQYVKS
ncbi:MAG: PD-(D/E)XK nuclease family protein [Patescibacteria group bacterium]|jgi:RecB family exonuclease